MKRHIPKTLVSILLLLAAILGNSAGSASAQTTKFIATQQRPSADLVRTLGGKKGHDVDVNNADILSDALASRLYDVITLPAGIIEITEPIVWPAQCGCTLLGAGENVDLGDSSFISANGGTCTRIVANFPSNDLPMITYMGKQGRMSGISLEGYRVFGGTWNYITAATNGNPIVCTTLGNHGYVDAQRVQIHGIRATSNTLANGNFYIDVLSNTTFALYSDSGLTTPVNGTAGGSTAFADYVIVRDYNRAQVGIHVVTYGISTFSTGKLSLENVTFHDLPIGILWGKNLEDCDATAGGRTLFDESAADGSYDGWNDPNADESLIDHCKWRWPLSNNDPGHRVASFHRTTQSTSFEFRFCTIDGWADEGSYFQRGGMADLHWHINGNCTWILRIGNPNFQGPFNLDINVDGGTTGGSGWNGRHTGVVYMDSAAISSIGCFINVSGTHRAGSVHYDSACDLPFFKLRGPCKCTIQDFVGLPKYSVQALGTQSGAGGDAENKPVIVTLKNVSTTMATPADTFNMFHTLVGSGDNQSTVPAIYRWYDCQRENAWNAAVTKHSWIMPVTDGQDITQDDDVEFQP